MIRDVMKLARVQAAPLNIFILLAGYGLSNGTLLDNGSIELGVLAVSGHIAFYSMNEYLDYEWDMRAGKYDKPLVSGDVDLLEARSVIFMSLGFCVGHGFGILRGRGFIAFCVALVAAALYNTSSKEDYLSPFYLGIYASSFVITGYFYGL